MSKTKEVKKNLVEVALRILEKEASTDEALLKIEKEIISNDQLLTQAVHLAAIDALSEARRRTRYAMTHTGENTQKKVSKEMQESIQSACRRFLDWPMMDGSKLGEATKKHLLKDAATYKELAKGNARNGKFLALIAEKLEEDQKVDDVFSNTELEKMMEEARK